MRAILTFTFSLALVVALAPPAAAQRFCMAPVRRASGGTAGPPASTFGGLDALQRSCGPQPPDFVGKDTDQLMSNVKLTNAQKDSVKRIDKLYAARQDTVADAAARAGLRNPQSIPQSSGDREARAFFLTPEMRALRTEHAAALRALLVADQTALFDRNLAEQQKKEGAGAPN